MRNDPTVPPTTDSIEQLRADMAADPEVRPVLDQRIRDQAQEFLILAMEYARKMLRTDDPWAGERLLIEALIWMREAHKNMDRELAAKEGPKTTVKAFNR